MRNISFLIILFTFFVGYANAQKYKTTNGTVSFFSDAPMEDIEATSQKVTSLLDLEKGDVAFLIPVSTFEFDKKLMQEHFNENYMESEKYPNATFQGKLLDYDANAKGTQNVRAEGEMTMHGVTNKVTVEGTLEGSGEKILLKAKFPIKVADYKVKIPKVVFYNIAEVVDVTLGLTYEKQ